MKRKYRKERKRTGIAAAVVLIILLALAAVAAVSQSGKNEAGRAESYTYLSDRATVTCAVGNGLAVASGNGLQVFNAAGLQTVGETYVMKSPALAAGGKYAAAYDAEGTAVKVFTENGIACSIQADGTIWYAAVSSTGRIAVCAAESGYKGAVSVYSSKGTLLYKWYCGTGYLVSACMSGDDLAVLTLTEAGSRVVFLRVNSEEAVGEVLIPDEVLIAIGFGVDGKLYGLTEEGLYLLAPENGAQLLYDFGTDVLKGFALDGGPVVALGAYRTGGGCRILMIKEGDAEVLAEPEESLKWLDVNKSFAAVLTETKLLVYSLKTGLLTAEYEVSSAERAWLCEDGTVEAASQHSADVFRAEPEKQKGDKS